MSISELTPVVGTGMYVYYKAAAVIASVTLLLGALGAGVSAGYPVAVMAFKGAWGFRPRRFDARSVPFSRD